MRRHTLDATLLRPLQAAVQSYIRAQALAGNVPRQLEFPCGDGYVATMLVTRKGEPAVAPSLREVLPGQRNSHGFYTVPGNRTDN